VDAIPPAQLVSDASADVPPDEAEDAPIPALVDAPCAEKLAALALVVQGPDARLHPARALPVQLEEPCKQAADRSAA